MSRRSLAAALSCALMLVGCQTTSTGTGTTSIITQAQSYAQTACGFLPTAETVANIFAAGDPTLATATTIANAICGAVGTGTKRMVSFRAAAPPTVAGVPVRGTRVR